MSRSPSRRTQPEEQAALLSSHEHDRTSSEFEAEPSRPTWQSWRKPSRHVTFAPSGDGEELPSPITMKHQTKRRWEQALLYAVLILVGAGVGTVFSRGLRRRASGDGLGDGPMVPPVYTLPPVSHPDRAELTKAHWPASQSGISDRSLDCSRCHRR